MELDVDAVFETKKTLVSLLDSLDQEYIDYEENSNELSIEPENSPFTYSFSLVDYSQDNNLTLGYRVNLNLESFRDNEIEVPILLQAASGYMVPELKKHDFKSLGIYTGSHLAPMDLIVDSPHIGLYFNKKYEGVTESMTKDIKEVIDITNRFEEMRDF